MRLGRPTRPDGLRSRARAISASNRFRSAGLLQTKPDRVRFVLDDKVFGPEPAGRGAEDVAR